MKKFQEPKYDITKLSEDNRYGEFVFQPLERGFGTTLGNALRRVLLSSLPGASVYSIEIAGARHEFSALDGVEEDVTSIILNLKDLVLTIDDEDDVTKELHIDVIGPCEITGADIVAPFGVEVINKAIHIANVAEGGRFSATLYCKNSRGYVTSENNFANIDHYATITSTEGSSRPIPTDSKYSPVEKVAYSVEPTRSGQDATFDKLTMKIFTNGGISAQEAIALAAQILIAHFAPIVELGTATKAVEVMAESKETKSETFVNMDISDLNLSVRSFNCLKRQGITTVEELIDRSEESLMAFRNLGKKSLKEIKDRVASLGLSFKSID